MRPHHDHNLPAHRLSQPDYTRHPIGGMREEILSGADGPE
jgi:hypothetical protein